MLKNEKMVQKCAIFCYYYIVINKGGICLNHLIEWFRDIDIQELYQNSEFIASLIVMILAFVLTRFEKTLVRRLVILFAQDKEKVASSRTIKSYTDVIATLFKYLTYLFAFFVILTINRVSIITFLTSAGFLGIMVTSAFSSLIQDVTNGFFIVFDAPFEIGDRVKINGHVGKVVEITSRYVVLIDASHNRYIINNRAIDSMVILDSGIDFRSELDGV